MSQREDEVRSRSASTPTQPPAWVFLPPTNGYDDETGSERDGMENALDMGVVEPLRPKSVPPEAQASGEPPAPPPLPAPKSIKERRKFSRKYGSGVYQESAQQPSKTVPAADTTRSSSMAVPLRSSDPYLLSSSSPPGAANSNYKEVGTEHILFCARRETSLRLRASALAHFGHPNRLILY